MGRAEAVRALAAASEALAVAHQAVTLARTALGYGPQDSSAPFRPPPPGPNRLVRGAQNRDAVAGLLARASGPTTVAEIVTESGLTTASVNYILACFRRDSRVRRLDGRPYRYELTGRSAGAIADTEAATPRDDAPAETPPARPSRRRCLKCGEAFQSEGAHHRVCGKCKTRADWRSGQDLVTGLT